MGTLISAPLDRRATGGPGPTPTGACCIGEDCSILTEAACIEAGGDYQGNSTLCDPNPCTEPFSCGSSLGFTCVGIMCDTNPSGGSYTSVFNLSPGFMAPAAHLSGTTGPSDFATLNWYVDITLDGMGGYSASYGGTVTGRYGDSQAFGPYTLAGTCGILASNTHTDRFCGAGSGECTDIFGCSAKSLLAFDGGFGFSVSLQMS